MVPMLTSHYNMGPSRVQYGSYGEQLYHYLNIISNNSKFPDINAYNNDNKIKIIVCSLQNESIY